MHHCRRRSRLSSSARTFAAAVFFLSATSGFALSAPWTAPAPALAQRIDLTAGQAVFAASTSYLGVGSAAMVMAMVDDGRRRVAPSSADGAGDTTPTTTVAPLVAPGVVGSSTSGRF